MSPPRMPLDVADYLQDTTHLNAEESGAYLHLIMGYWVAGKLPNDDHQLAAIAKLSPTRFRRKRKLFESFFGEGFSSHKRIDRELQRAERIKKSLSERGKEGAQKRWQKHAWAIGRANAQAMAGDATKKERKKDTIREIEVGAVDNSGQVGQKGSAEEVSGRTAEALARMRRRKGTG